MNSPGSTLNIKFEWFTDVSGDTSSSIFYIECHSAPVKKMGIQIAEYQVGIGNCGALASQSVADWPWIGTRTFGANMDNSKFRACN